MLFTLKYRLRLKIVITLKNQKKTWS
jgi:hypothetical protein